MRLSRQMLLIESQEPVGLVIADGGLGDHIPRFSAFVWGPVPEEEEEAPTRMVDGRHSDAIVRESAANADTVLC